MSYDAEYNRNLPSIDWDKFYQGDLISKDIGPHLYNIFQRAGRSDTPFGMDPLYELDKEALSNWFGDHAFAVGSGFFAMGMVFMAMKNPDKIAPVIEALGNAVGSSLTGVGEIVKGIGEVIPG